MITSARVGRYNIVQLYIEILERKNTIDNSLQSTADNSNLEGNRKKVRVSGILKKIAESKVKNSFYCTVNVLITFSCRNNKCKLKDTSRL